ncbi:MAG: hypothetical protein HFF50_01190 [Lawsonibacter sp.]|nr:hypothetical protein [Lawsonibacter sp.]
MYRHRRIPAVLLAASMLFSALPPSLAAESKTADTARASLSATVRIDRAQTIETLRDRTIQAELFQGSKLLGKVDLTRTGSKSLGGCPAQVTQRDWQGSELNGNTPPGALDLTVDGLEPGNYTLRFTGQGYRTCQTSFAVKDYNVYVEVGTGDGTFTLGDLNGDGTVNATDRNALSAALGSQTAEDRKTYDLNGDGKIDIIDLAYVNRNLQIPQAQPEVKETVCIAPALDQEKTVGKMDGTTFQGDLSNLFLDNEESITFYAEKKDQIVIPLVLEKGVEAQEVQVATPDTGAGAVLAGFVTVEDAGGAVYGPFDFSTGKAVPTGVHALDPTPGSNVITISLGKRVVVKTITITVTKTEDDQGYAVVKSVQFLKDIVPEDLSEPNTEVTGLRAEAGDAQAALTWKELPNVSGYQVEYWQKEKESTRRRLQVDVPKAQVTGLENLKTYCFTVTPVDGNWTGQTCKAVEATPLPAKAPDAPDMVSVAELDASLRVSWKVSKTATYYEVYYTDQENAPIASYRQAGGRVASAPLTIDGLTNGTTYYLYVVAGNEIGKSSPSRISSGTPEATDYSRPEGIPTEGILDNGKISSVRLADAGNYDSASYTAAAPFKPENMIDGDFHTHWTASSNFMRNEHVICTFTEPVDLSAAIWVPRLDGSYPSNMRAYSVRVWYQGDDLNGPGTLLVPDPEKGGIDNGGTSNAEVGTWPNIPNFSTAAVQRFGILPFGPVKNVAKISLAVEQQDYTQISLSELMFMEYDPSRSLPDNIAALFADELHTTLDTGVDQAAIDALKARLDSDERHYYLNLEVLEDELALAQELLAGKSSGAVLRQVEYPYEDGSLRFNPIARSNAADGTKYGQGGSELQPLGVAAGAGDEITIYVQQIPEGGKVTVYASQYNAEASTWLAQVGVLENGRNILTIPKIGSQNTPRGGSLYFTYSGPKTENMAFHVRRAVKIPVLELSDWYSLEETARKQVIQAYVDELSAYVTAQGINNTNATTSWKNVTEISMPTVLLSIPASTVKGTNLADNLYQNVLAWEDLMHICKTTQGIDKTYADNDMTTRQNIRCMQMFAGAFMYAAGNHVGIGYRSCGGMTGGVPISRLPANTTANQLFGWGIAHEIGHNMDKLGRAEITNNLYSLMVQTYDGKQNTLASRLEKSGKYPAIFTKTAQGYPGESNDVFVQLGMYWQLHLAYDNGASPMAFYNQFFKDWKAGTYTKGGAYTYEEKVALTACGVAKKDLTEFFTRWGMTLSEQVTDQLKTYPAEERALWYLSDQSRRDRLAGKTASAGTVTAKAALSGEQDVVVTITPSITGAVQGYEILRGGVPIAFVVPEEGKPVTYTDHIGSANHRVFSYQVKAYDTLGGQVGQTAEAGDVRIAYDKTVPAEAYTVVQDGNTVTFTLNSLTDVSGVKFPESLPEGMFEVKVTCGDNEESKEVSVRTGSFGDLIPGAGGGRLAYFQKENAQADDTRIWTYTVKKVTVTGVPDGTEIQLISYAGDDVAFLEKGAVGVLEKEYRYGEGTGDVIPAGTLIIAGTYRCNPVFASVELRGCFTETTDEGEVTEEIRPLDGKLLVFAEVHADGLVSDISDGLFLFIPNVQKEAELQGETSKCDGVNLLPSRMQAVLKRTSQAGSADAERTTAETMWIETPGGADLPAIVLEGEEA